MPQTVQPPSRSHAAVFADTESYATELLVCFVDTFRMDGETGDDDPFNWQAESIRLEIEDRYKIRMPAENVDRLMAAISILKSDEFEQKAATFVQFCNVLCGSPVSPDVFDKATVAECSWGYFEARLLDPGIKLSAEVRGYLKIAMQDEGLSIPPAALEGTMDDTSGVLNDYADDVETFQSAWKNKQNRTQEINEAVDENIDELMANLKRLSLKNGKTAFLFS